MQLVGVTQAALCLVGKPTALNVAKTNSYPLQLLGSADAPIEDVVREATKFISACYGCESTEMSWFLIKIQSTYSFL